MFLKIGILSLAIAFTLFGALAVFIQQTGVMIVDVRDRDGRFFLPIPMIFVNGALSIAPLAQRVSIPQGIEKHSDLMEAAAQELLECPDGPFVEIDSRDTKVLVVKRGENLIVDVKSDEEKVYVQIPIRATGKTLAKLAAVAQNSKIDTETQ